MQLGIPATEVKAVDIWQGVVRERTPEHELGTGSAEAVQVLGVIELEGGVARDADPRSRRRARRRHDAMSAAERHRDRQDPVKIDRRLESFCETRAAFGG